MKKRVIQPQSAVDRSAAVNKNHFYNAKNMKNGTALNVPTDKKKRRIHANRKTSTLDKEKKQKFEETIGNLKDDLSIARRQIENFILAENPPNESIDISSYISDSSKLLGHYVTLDWQHQVDILRIMDNITNYAEDRKRRRPLNIILQAEPGSGKSHFIKCLADRMSICSIKEVVFNMATMEHLDDLVMTLEDVRNLKVNDKLPLLFLDEFDCNERNFSILLPLMWDGTLQVGHHYLEVGKVVIVLAGSQTNISKAMESSQEMSTKIFKENSKMIDLLSRINGGSLRIPGLDEVSNDRNRKVDKVCISVSLLLRRFESLENVPWLLLKFISYLQFRYGVRSISTLIDLIPLNGREIQELKMKDMEVLFRSTIDLKDSGLARHIICEEGPAHVVDFWIRLKKINKPVRIVKKKEKSSLSSLDAWFRFLWGKQT